MQTALSVCAAALASLVDVEVWLAGEAAWLGTSDPRGCFPLDAEAAGLLDVVLGAAPVRVCARCAQRRGITPADLRPGAQIAGAAGFVASVTEEGVQALVY